MALTDAMVDMPDHTQIGHDGGVPNTEEQTKMSESSCVHSDARSVVPGTIWLYLLLLLFRLPHRS